MDWNLYNTFINANGSTPRDRKINELKNSLNKKLENSASCKSIKINNVDKKLIILKTDLYNKKKIQTLEAHKKHWREKATKPVEVKKDVAKEVHNDNTEDITVARLEARGYIEADEQEEIIRAAKALGISAIDAIKDELVLARIEKIRNKKKTQDATPEPKGRASGVQRDVNYYISKGEMPTDGDMADKVIEALRAKERAKRI
jgi:hypothetical protein